jgi:transcription termination/antitermination protein NusG
VADDSRGQSEGATMDPQAEQAPIETPAAQPPAPAEPEIPGRHWYAIHTYSGYENKVKQHIDARVISMSLKDRIFRVLVPTEEVVEVKNGQRRVVTRKIYPGYVLVDMVLDDATWYAVRNTPGVTGFVGGMGTEPVPLTPEELRYILPQAGPKGPEGEESAATAAAPKPKPKITYQVGQSVKIIDGPFTDFIGTVSEIAPERNKVTVLVSFFGRETPVTLDFLQVEKV